MAGNHRSGPRKTAPASFNDPLTDVSPPADLGEAEISYWSYYAPTLRLRGLWTISTRDVLRTYCEALVLRDRLQKRVTDEPLVTEVVTIDGAGQERISYKPHPLLTQLRQVRLECRLHANDLSLSPMTASKMPETVAKTDGDDRFKPRIVRKRA